jgi:hypothetical protein
MKIEETLEADQFGFTRGKGTRDATRVPGIISEQTLEIHGELCACFTDRQKVFDCVI